MHPYPASMHFAITPLCIYRYSYQLLSSHSWSVKSKGEINIFHPCKVVSKGTLTYCKLTSKYPHRGRLTESIDLLLRYRTRTSPGLN